MTKNYNKANKKYISVMSLDSHAWVFDAGDDLNQMMVNFKHVLQQIKYGENVEFIDLLGELKPIKVSNKAILFWW